MMIDFSRYIPYFEYYCWAHDITFKSQEEADCQYCLWLWIEGFEEWTTYVYY